MPAGTDATIDICRHSPIPGVTHASSGDAIPLPPHKSIMANFSMATAGPKETIRYRAVECMN